MEQQIRKAEIKQEIKEEAKAAFRFYFNILASIVTLSPQKIGKAFATFSKEREGSDNAPAQKQAAHTLSKS